MLLFEKKGNILKTAEVELFEKFRDKHREFYNEVKRLHDSYPNQRGHDMYHNIHVALFGLKIADQAIQELVWLSAIPHSLDRIAGDNNFETNIRNCLKLVKGLNVSDIETVFDAVMNHGKLNEDSDSPVLVALKDADRLANMFLTLVIRVGQHRPNIPACEMKYLRKSNPACPTSDLASHSKPQSSLDDLRYCSTNWPKMMRTPKGKVLIGPLAAEITTFLDKVASQYEWLGMDQIDL